MLTTNINLQTVLQNVAAGGSVNVGEIFWWPLETPPGDALVCDGRDVSRGEYAALFEVIGTQFGAGDGESTFGLPDMRGEGSTTPCVRYKRKGLPWCAGVFQDRSLGAVQGAVLVPIYESGDNGLISGNTFLARSEGIYSLTTGGGNFTYSGGGNRYAHILKNSVAEFDTNNDIISSSMTNAQIVPGNAVIIYLNAGDFLTHLIVSGSGSSFSSMRYGNTTHKFTFAKIG